MEEHMYQQVLLKAMTIIQTSRFLSAACDEIKIMDNASWISIHACVVKNWSHVLILISLDHVIVGANSKTSQKLAWLQCAMVVDWAKKTLPTIFLPFGARNFVCKHVCIVC
jgi:hypothetical protein